ncbi:MAG: DUF11 domain-containing protein [Xanthomonadales bacterium]|nr:DUF11 domain-containing protein [Xanthomonadales bacterium]
MKAFLFATLASLIAGSASAAEMTVQNDSLSNFSTAIIEAGFVTGEKGASWLTSPCDGNIVAVQIFWLSATGGTGQLLGQSIEIYRSGTFPEPGALAQQINGPLLSDGVINEYRFLDDNNTVPLIVPVTNNETFVVAYTFSEDPLASGPSLAVDADGIHTGRNAIYAHLFGSTYAWLSSESFSVPGDWVIRAVVNCQSAGSNANVSTLISTSPALYTPGDAISHTITISNAGPANASSVTVVDLFPSAYLGTTWLCAASAGATCTSGGAGNISQAINLPTGSHVTYTVNATVNAGTTGILSNSVTAIVNAPASDPDTENNTDVANTPPASDRIFASGFDT